MTSPLIPAGLRCAHQTGSLGVTPDRVRFSWILEGEGRDRAQTAYQILLTQDDTQVWDSGRVESAATTDIAYGGPPLAAGTRYRWKVQIWDESRLRSAYSSPAVFETELERTYGWHASWITLGRVREEFRPPSEPGPSDPVVNALLPPPYLRREFRLDQPAASARLYITALGLYEARLNGQRVGDAVLAPGWTDYARRIPYQAYDVTGLLRPGDNVLGVIAADGWACGFFGFDAKRAGRHYAEAPELLAQLDIRLADGTEERIVTDGQWRAAFAAIRHADLLMGERHDLTREPHGWDAPGFDDGHWREVRVRARDATPLVADPGPPIRVTEEIAPRSIATDDHGRHIVDFGQNLTGWLRLGLDGPAGARIRIRHGEVLAPDGSLYTDNLRTARAVDEFATAGGAEVLEPRFTLHGFRYAEITGYPGDIEQADITARVVHSDIPATGSFASSQPWLDQLWRNIDWGQRGNFISVPTDCPQRDERLGWLADAQVFARTACYNRDVAAFFAKWLDDVADAQYDSGVYPDIAPRLNIPWAGAPAWADGGVIVPWTVWKMYGDTTILDRHFDGMARWMAYLERANPGYLRTRELGNSYNDWLAPVEDKTPVELLATAYWAYDATLMAEIAEATGRPGEAAGYRELLAQIRSAFMDAFVAADGQVTSGTQTAYVLGLHMDLIPGERRAAAAGHLAAAIRRENWHLTTGFAGVGYILPVLTAAGYDAIAYRLLEQASAPSWRYMVDAGATTIWERWDGWTAERGFQSARMNSFNHYALGSVGEWLYRFVLGIDQEPGTAGFGRLLVRPHPGGSLSWARGTYRSVRGPIASGWRRDHGRFTFWIELPPNVVASVRIPSDDPAAVRDQAGTGPVSVAGYPGALGATEAVFTVGSGSHEFAGPALTGYGR
ncbi:MAG: family 78 glycoside hydrolase catalytic domain [Streptosporangiaceae bacterium]